MSGIIRILFIFIWVFFLVGLNTSYYLLFWFRLNLFFCSNLVWVSKEPYRIAEPFFSTFVFILLGKKLSYLKLLYVVRTYLSSKLCWYYLGSCFFERSFFAFFLSILHALFYIWKSEPLSIDSFWCNLLSIIPQNFWPQNVNSWNVWSQGQ